MWKPVWLHQQEVQYHARDLRIDTFKAAGRVNPFTEAAQISIAIAKERTGQNHYSKFILNNCYKLS